MTRPTRTNTRRARLAPLLAVGVLLGLAACTPPPPRVHVLDQQNIGLQQNMSARVDAYVCNSKLWNLEVAQSFTAGVSGMLDQVSLVAWKYPSAGSLDVAIRPLGPDGLPGSTTLGDGSYSGSQSSTTQTFLDIPLAHPAKVVKGTQYAIVVTTPVAIDCPSGTIYGWNLFGSTDSYSGGQVWQRGSIANAPQWQWSLGPSDLYFSTWVVRR
jgi:hypothetical protein